MARTFLFVYGKLQPSYYPPSTMASFSSDTVLGILHEVGNDPRLSHLGQGDHEIHGYTLTIDDSELPALDKDEEPVLHRVRTTTQNGRKVWIYVTEETPEGARKIDQWPTERGST